MEQYVTVYEKVTTWLKHTIQVDDVNSNQEAINKIIDYYKENNEPPYENGLYTQDSEEISECEESITVEENNGYSTIEIMDGHNVVWDNGKIR